MIQSFQKFSQSRLAKIFLAIVALSFIAFFGGGQWFNSSPSQQTIAEVGPTHISYLQFMERLNQRIQEIMSQTQGSISRETLLQTGVPQMVLSQLIQENLLDLAAKKLKLTVSDKSLREYIHNLKAFHNKKGEFDRTLFNQVLRANNLSDDAFISLVQQDLIREQLVKAITIGASLPQALIDRLFDAYYQQRQASMVIVSPKDMPQPSLPPIKELEGFYKIHKETFRHPERRTLTVLILDPSAISKDQVVTEEEIQSVYEAKPDTFGEKPLKDVRSLVIKDIQQDRAIEAIYKLSQDLDDKIAAGSTLEEIVAEESRAKLIKLVEIDAHGLSSTRTPSQDLPKNPDLTQDILQTGFELEANTDSPFSESQNGTYYIVRVDTLTPSTLPAFSSIQDEVEQAWIKKEQVKAAKKKAESYANAFNQGDKKLALMRLLPTLSLSAPSPTVDPKIKNLVCSLPLNHTGITQLPDGFAVIVLNKILPPSTDIKEKQRASFSKELLKNYKEDILTAYLNSLRIHYPVKINTRVLQTPLTKE